MKLVIELDKVAYDLLTGKIETANIDLFSTLIKAVQNGTPLEEELETILAEEAELSEQSGFVSVAELISNRIEELKEE